MKTVVAAALGECVHVAGISNFLRLAEAAGWRTVFLGPAVPIEQVLEAARREKADLVGVSYRLTPETGERLLGQFAEEAAELHATGVRFAFGGTPPVAERARALGFFERIFDGSEPPEAVLAYLKGQRTAAPTETNFPQTTVERIRWKSPYPLLRHHFGLPTMEATLEGIEQIADARALDVISWASTRTPRRISSTPNGRTRAAPAPAACRCAPPEDYRTLYAASRRGNFPLLRTYSGTDDFIRLAEMYVETINIAWCAIPLFWFNQMDGRGPWDLEGSIREHQQVMAWYGSARHPGGAERAAPLGHARRPRCGLCGFGLPVGLQRPRLRRAGLHRPVDVQQPAGPVGRHGPGQDAGGAGSDRAAGWAKFPHLAADPHRLASATRSTRKRARAHLAASVYLQMALKPHIVHVVGHTEAAPCRHRRGCDRGQQAGAPGDRECPAGQPGHDRRPAGAGPPEAAGRRSAAHPGGHPVAGCPRAWPIPGPTRHPGSAVTTGILDAPSCATTFWTRASRAPASSTAHVPGSGYRWASASRRRSAWLNL